MIGIPKDKEKYQSGWENHKNESCQELCQRYVFEQLHLDDFKIHCALLDHGKQVLFVFF